MKSIVLVALTIAFLPLAGIVAKLILPTLNPPKYRPLIFIFCGAFFFLFGVLGGSTLLIILDSDTVHFTTRLLGEVYADAHQQPIKYWAVVLSIYSTGLFISGLGLAGIGLAFYKRRNK